MSNLFARGATVAALAGLGVLQAAAAKDARNEQADRWMTLRLVEGNYRVEPLSRDDARKRLTMIFNTADLDGNGVSQNDYDRAQRIRVALQRASTISQILRDDLNGDWSVTRAEVTEAHSKDSRQLLSGGGGATVEPTPAQIDEVLKQIVSRTMNADANNDGVMTREEMAAYADKASLESSRYSREQPVPLFLDTNGDGVVSKAEFNALFDRAFNTVDTNRDGRVSVEERAALQGAASRWRNEEQAAQREQRETEQAQALAQKCGLPKVPQGTKIAVVSVYEGQGISTVALGGDDEEVTVARVIIEKGSEPLALVLTSHSANIWLVDGDVARLRSVIAGSNTGDANKAPRVGVVGVPSSKVTIAKSSECLRYTSGAKRQPEVLQQMTALQLGRKADFAFADYGVATVALPSGKTDKDAPLPNAVAPRSTGSLAGIWKSLLRFNPKGLITIDPSSVVSATKASRYKVLPQEAGLAQLVESGALEVTGSSREVQLGGTTVVLGEGDDTIRGAQGQRFEETIVPSQYTIRKQMTFPAGLAGAHSVKFVLPAGVPEPLGDPGHSDVVRVR